MRPLNITWSRGCFPVHLNSILLIDGILGSAPTLPLVLTSISSLLLLRARARFGFHCQQHLMGRLIKKQDQVDASDSYSDPYSYPPAAESTGSRLDDYPPFGTASTQSFIGRDQAIPGGRKLQQHNTASNTYPPLNDDYAFEKGGNPVNRGSIAAQVSAVSSSLS